MSTEELRRDLRALAQSALPIQGLPEGFSSGGSVTLDPATLLRLLDRIDALERALERIVALGPIGPFRLPTDELVAAQDIARSALSETS